jgi:putative ABC transport system ATP-binding protein
MADEAAIEIEGLRHDYGGGTVLALPSWRLVQGRHALVLGRSGSGKTTLLHLIAGLLRPNAGRLRVTGAEMTRLRPVARDRLRGQALGIVFQHLHLIGAVSVLDNLRLARRMAGLAPDDTHLRGLLAALGLADKAARRPRGLSFGEAQRVAIARALANRPRLLLADEPTAALDDDNCARVAELLLAQAAAAGASLLVATHDRRLAGHFEERLELAGGCAP